MGGKQAEKFIHRVCFLVIEQLRNMLERKRIFQKIEPKVPENKRPQSNFQRADLT